MERADRHQVLKVGDIALLDNKEVTVLHLRKRSAIVLKEDGYKTTCLKRKLVSKSDYVMNKIINQLK
jgi:hypothetical protein